MRIGWISGWAVPESWFAGQARGALPAAEHVVVGTRAGAVEALLRRGPFDRVCGYSLGSHLLLSQASALPPGCPVSLLAPIWSFCSEEDRGGKISRTQIRLLARWLRTDLAAALLDFYSRSGLGHGAWSLESVAAEDLPWGLEVLAASSMEPRLPKGWSAWCGSDDALIDANRLRDLEPRVKIVSGVTHHPAGLLRALAEEMR
jgi:hypothetical protein